MTGGVNRFYGELTSNSDVFGCVSRHSGSRKITSSYWGSGSVWEINASLSSSLYNETQTVQPSSIRLLIICRI